MIHLTCRTLGRVDADSLHKLLQGGPPDYCRHFRPFAFDLPSVRGQLERAARDRFVAVEVRDESCRQLAGFYMLRGLDEGYRDPMFGVFIDHAFQGQGLARFALAHAESYCKGNGLQRLLLKVHPENTRAKNLYEWMGYRFLREESTNGNVVLFRDLVDPWHSAGMVGRP
jgi:RimJ/RimL family protein N-acetyltransferase